MNRIFGMFVVVCLLLASCKESTLTSEEAEPSVEESNILSLNDAQTKIAKIELGTLSQITMGNTLSLLGKIEAMPSQKSSVSSIHEGFIKNVKWIPGMTVRKGQVLFTVENRELIQLQQDYLSTKNLLYYSVIDFERQKELVKNQAVSDKIFQQAEEKVKQQEILKKSLAQKLKYYGINAENISTENFKNSTLIYAPINGTITNINVNSGAYIHTGDELMTIVDAPSSRWVCRAFEKDIVLLSIGQKVLAYHPSDRSKIYTGRIEYIVRNIEDDGYAKVICKPDQPLSNAFEGMMINVQVEAQVKKAWSLPDKAIVNFEGKEYVFIERSKDTYELYEIVKGIHENAYTEIVNFESISDKNIVIEGAYTLLMKMKNVSED